MTTFLFEYTYAGAVWALPVEAVDRHEAEARVGAMGRADFKGEVFHKLAAAPDAHLSVVEP